MHTLLPLLVLVVVACAVAVEAAPAGRALYVSKLGNGSDGSSWANAFTTIQAALDAVPEGGGTRIVVRPDTYFENNLFPAHKGAPPQTPPTLGGLGGRAPGGYNELVGDFDGSLGSGTTGWVVIDCSDPEQKGFKSYDWWGPIRSYARGWSPQHTEETFSAIGWDRWKLRHLYVTGGDGGIFFDCTDQVKPFSVVVEDCVAIGRAFGGGVASCLSRPDEPITYRRCHLWALDFWGDTSGAYVRVENQKMPDRPDAVFEECVLVGPQCALKASNFGFHTFTRVRLDRCRLVALNFSQPAGTPTDGIIQSVQEGKLLHVDLDDCTLMGYKVFGVIVNKETAGEIGCTTKGDVKAYVQFQQEVPKGIHRMPHWPVEAFQALAPPSARRPSPFVARELVARDLCELSPFVWKGRLCHMECVRPGSGGTPADYYLSLKDAETGEEFARCAEGHGLASILVHRGVFYVFASRWEDGNWRDVTLFRSSDLKRWEKRVVVEGENEGVFNTSVCKGPDGFVMAYESNDPAYPAFTTKFARSKDLLHWEKLPEATFGTNRYTACPCLRYANGYFYVLYLERRSPRHVFETYITRSKDLRRWELSAANPVLRAEEIDEGINASDPELVEVGGQTYLYFAVGDQLTWMNLKRARYLGRMAAFLESWYRQPGIPDWGGMAPRAVIFDTDMGGDCDDAGALAVLHALADRGEARILAVTSCTSAEATPGCIDAINTYYGRPEIPVGALKEDGFMANMDESYCRAVAAGFPNRIRRRGNALDSVGLLRRALAGQPDGSVYLVAVGPLRNIRLLLESSPDGESPLDGRALAKAKVRELGVMGGWYGAVKPFEQAGEWNFAQDPASAAKVAAEWPTPILYSGFEIGLACPTGARLTTETPETNPVRRSYELWHKKPGQNRPSWDLTSALAAVRGPAPWWSLGPAGRCVVDATNGANRWEASPSGKDRYLVLRTDPAEVARALDDLLVAPPASR